MFSSPRIFTVCELFIRRSLAEHFLQSDNSRAQSYCQLLSWDIPGLNRTSYALLLGYIYKSESRGSLFRNAEPKHRLRFQSHMVHLCILYLWCRATQSIYVYFIYGLEPHGPSMYTFSMVYSHMVHLCILYLGENHYELQREPVKQVVGLTAYYIENTLEITVVSLQVA